MTTMMRDEAERSNEIKKVLKSGAKMVSMQQKIKDLYEG